MTLCNITPRPTGGKEAAAWGAVGAWKYSPLAMNLSGKLVTFVKDSISLSFTSDSITGLKVGQIFQGPAGYQIFQFGSQGQDNF